MPNQVLGRALCRLLLLSIADVETAKCLFIQIHQFFCGMFFKLKHKVVRIVVTWLHFEDMVAILSGQSLHLS